MGYVFTVAIPLPTSHELLFAQSCVEGYVRQYKPGQTHTKHTHTQTGLGNYRLGICLGKVQMMVVVVWFRCTASDLALQTSQRIWCRKVSIRGQTPEPDCKDF
jgi:hypothetical protein